jgi:predicted lipoprotein with Yx(FWY)xxD motif
VRRAFVGAPIVITAGLLVAACGSSSSSSSSASATGTGTATPASTSAGSSSGSPYGGGTSSTSASASATAGAGTEVTTKRHGKLGTILAVGSKKLTVYMFAGDKGSTSTCTGACAAAWPPVIAKGAPKASGGAASSSLGTTPRAAGLMQVTYKGHPLYYFIKDKDDGDAYGQGAHAFGADWYVLAPSGEKVDNS